MISATCSACQASFNLKDELAWKKWKCPNCQSIFSIPAAPSAEQTSTTAETPAKTVAHAQGVFKEHIYGVKQKRLAIDERYFIRNNENTDVFFSLRRMQFWRRFGALMAGVAVLVASFVAMVSILPKDSIFFAIPLPIVLMIVTIVYLSPKRHIEFFFSEKDSKWGNPEFTVSQNSKIEFPRQTYSLSDTSGQTVATFHKNIFTDIFRKTWHLEFSGKHIIVKEDSIILGLLRRWMPYGQLIRTNFIFIDASSNPKSSDIIGYFKRKFELFDNYVLDMTKDPGYLVPRQFALCMAVLLDTGERR